MKKYKQQVVLLFGALAVFSYLSIQYLPKQKQESISVMNEVQQEQIQIYVLDKDNVLLPVAMQVDAGLSIEEKLNKMIASMCADQVKDDFSGVLGTGTSLEHVDVQDGLASLYFNDTFATYQKDQELAVLEALVWGATQFDEIKQVELYMNQAKMTSMPLAHTPIPQPLNRDIGINHFESATSMLHHGDTITVFYTKEINGTSYFVPKSKRIEGNGQDMETVVKEVLKDVSATSMLAQPLYEDNIDTMDLPRRDDDTLVVNMNTNLLASDRSAKQTAYEALVLSLSCNFQTDKVMVYVDDSVVSLHGSNEEAVSVSSLYYNPIPF